MLWKFILRIRDLIKIWRGNANFTDGIQELSALREAGFPEIFARDAWCFVSLSGMREMCTTQISVPAAKWISQMNTNETKLKGVCDE